MYVKSENVRSLKEFIMLRSVSYAAVFFYFFTSAIFFVSAQEPSSEQLEVPKVLVDALVMKKQQIQPELKLPGVVEPLIEGRLTSEIRGIITRVEKNLGDKVESDDIIMYVKNTQVGQSFREYAVRSPVDGFVTRLPVLRGSFIEPNQDLGTVMDTNSLRIVGQVPAVHLASLERGQKAKLKLGREEMDAKISGVARQVEAETGTARVELTPDKQDGRLVAGSVGELTIFMKELNTLAIPLSAKVEIGESVYVRKIVDDKIVITPVELGRMIGQQRVIISGLEVGDEIVTRATDYLKDGDGIKRTSSTKTQQESE